MNDETKRAAERAAPDGKGRAEAAPPDYRSPYNQDWRVMFGLATTFLYLLHMITDALPSSSHGNLYRRIQQLREDIPEGFVRGVYDFDPDTREDDIPARYPRKRAPGGGTTRKSHRPARSGRHGGVQRHGDRLAAPGRSPGREASAQGTRFGAAGGREAARCPYLTIAENGV